MLHLQSVQQLFLSLPIFLHFKPFAFFELPCNSVSIVHFAQISVCCHGCILTCPLTHQHDGDDRSHFYSTTMIRSPVLMSASFFCDFVYTFLPFLSATFFISVLPHLWLIVVLRGGQDFYVLLNHLIS